MISKSTYTWEEISKNGHQIIIIVDHDEGMSVTNNVGNVLREIANERQQRFLNEIIIYKDTEGNWDGIEFNASNGRFAQFYPLRSREEKQAIENALAFHGITK